MRPAPPAEVNRILAKTYPDAKAELDFRDAFELLVATVLSAQSTDRRVNAVTAVLFARYPTVGALAQADLADVEETIKPVGFFRTKAAAIVGLSRRIVDDFDGRVPDTLAELVTLPGSAARRPTSSSATRSASRASPPTRTSSGSPTGSAGCTAPSPTTSSAPSARCFLPASGSWCAIE